MKRTFAVALAALALVMLAGDAQAQAKPKRIAVAVMDFEYGTLDNWWGNYDIGKGMADQVVDALVEDGTFSVIERKKLDAVLAEQDFAQSNRAAPSAATLAKVGKIKGIQYILSGSITKYTTERKDGGIRVKGIGLGGGKGKAEVHLTVRLIDVTTGEILVSAKGVGESKKGGAFSFSSGSVGVGMGSSEYRNSALGDAQAMACTDLVAKIVAKKDRLEE
ncbi:MAG: CsgG/HfaB family protein [Vicinamibacteria bacterium]|jgi:curli biogenesis system outer membrane secretion channel CsgG|nr:CsgG/HfaB family protein [Vicinamibacteria bacterium]